MRLAIMGGADTLIPCLSKTKQAFLALTSQETKNIDLENWKNYQDWLLWTNHAPEELSCKQALPVLTSQEHLVKKWRGI